MVSKQPYKMWFDYQQVCDMHYLESLHNQSDLKYVPEFPESTMLHFLNTLYHYGV